MILNDIKNAVSDFTTETGKIPRYLYLGSTELEALRKIAFLSDVIVIDENVSSYNGMTVLEVSEEHHLRCS